MRTSDITIPFDSVEAANIALAAIAPDNGDFVEATLQGSELRLRFQSESTMGLLRSIDDVLGCLRAIEQAES
ncbi:MAG: KEOPS complex subunit Pcc1 [Thermoplasmatota archaeon]